MARYGPADCIVNYNSVVITGCTMVGNLAKEMMLEEITPLGSAWQTHASVGVGFVGEVTLEEPYDSSASPTLRAVAEAVGLGGTATLLVTIGGTKTFSVSTIVRRLEREPARGALTKFRAVLQPTGAVTEA